MEKEVVKEYSFNMSMSYLEDERWDIIARGLEKVLESMREEGVLNLDVDKVSVGVVDGGRYTSDTPVFNRVMEKKLEIVFEFK